jgi:hypothetical protein
MRKRTTLAAASTVAAGFLTAFGQDFEIHFGDSRELHPLRERPLFRQCCQGRRLRKVPASTRACGDQQSDDHSLEPRHTLFRGGVRPQHRPVSITLPDAGKSFMSMQVINEDQ